MSFITRNWRILVLLTFLLLSLILIRPQFGQEGVVVSFVSDTSPAKNVLQKNDIIRTINGESIQDAQDVLKFYNKEANVNGIPISNFTGIDVVDHKTTRINLGLELVGGARVILQPEQKIDSDTAATVIETLDLRVNAFGLKDFKLQPIRSGDSYFIQVEIAGGTQEEVKDLLEKQGKLEAKSPLYIPLTNGQGMLKLDSTYTVAATPTQATVNGNTLIANSSNSTAIIEGVKFEYNGIVNNKAILTAIVFTGPDIEISKDTTRSTVQGNQFTIGLVVSSEGAERFAKITKNMQSSQGFLESPLIFYLDDRQISSFNIGSELKGKIVRDPSISGSRETQEAAIQEKKEIEAVLRSGALPVKLNIVKSDTISPVLGSEFIKSAFTAGIIAILAVFTVTYMRYRNLKISLLMNLINVSEVVIILGLSALIGATIDLPAIAGIIAVVGTGINQLIIITDETRSNENISLKAKIKRGLFIIFGSAATLLSAMFPLMIIGLGSIKSFAIMTILGVLIGILVTRPAYAQLYEHMIEKNQ